MSMGPVKWASALLLLASPLAAFSMTSTASFTITGRVEPRAELELIAEGRVEGVSSRFTRIAALRETWTEDGNASIRLISSNGGFLRAKAREGSLKVEQGIPYDFAITEAGPQGEGARLHQILISSKHLASSAPGVYSDILSFQVLAP